MAIFSGQPVCPKCDAVLSRQTDGSTITLDIAHQGERVSEAIKKLDNLIEAAGLDITAKLRLIVGSGLIREEVVAQLGTYLYRGEILGFDQDGGNRGAILVILKK